MICKKKMKATNVRISLKAPLCLSAAYSIAAGSEFCLHGYRMCFHVSHLVRLRNACMLSVILHTHFWNLPMSGEWSANDYNVQTPVAVKFKRLNTVCGRNTLTNSITQDLTLSELINSGTTITNNYRINFHLLLQNDFLCFKGPYKYICVKNCLFFHWVTIF